MHKVRSALTTIEQVAEFHEAMAHPISETIELPDASTLKFRTEFIQEELKELVDAVKEGDIVKMADGLGDIQYVLDGFFLNVGLHPYKEEICTAIHESNMSKKARTEDEALESVRARQAEFPEYHVMHRRAPDGEGYVIFDDKSGKILKPVGYFKPKIKAILELHTNIERHFVNYTDDVRD